MTPQSIPILNYHKIEERADIGITTRRPVDFEEDLLFLKEQGFQTITFRDLLNPEKLPPKPVILTFDDAYRSVLDKALPLMEKVGYVGVVFVPTSFVGKKNDWDVQFFGKTFFHLTEDDLRLLASKGFEIASHGCSHRDLKSMEINKIRHELKQSKKYLETITGQQVITISYPFGRFDQRILQIARESGYRFGVASLYFKLPEQFNGLAQLALRRFNIYRGDSRRAFAQKVSRKFNSPLGLRDWLIQKGSLATVYWQKWFTQQKG